MVGYVRQGLHFSSQISRFVFANIPIDVLTFGYCVITHAHQRYNLKLRKRPRTKGASKRNHFRSVDSAAMQQYRNTFNLAVGGKSKRIKPTHSVKWGQAGRPGPFLIIPIHLNLLIPQASANDSVAEVQKRPLGTRINQYQNDITVLTDAWLKLNFVTDYIAKEPNSHHICKHVDQIKGNIWKLIRVRVSQWFDDKSKHKTLDIKPEGDQNHDDRMSKEEPQPKTTDNDDVKELLNAQFHLNEHIENNKK